MSVFSRIFQKNSRDSKSPKADPAASTNDAATTNHSSNHSAAPQPTTPSTPPRRSMRPVAPPLEMRSERPPKTSAAPAPPASPPPDVRELFVTLAANHMRPLRDVMIGLKWGDPMSSPASICSPIVTSLMKAANEMGFAELTKGLGTFAGVLDAKAGGEGTLDAAAREAVLTAYGKLSTQMPDVFALEGEQGRREAVIVHALLRQIPEVSHLALQRVYAAGLANLDVMLLAEADGIASTTGIDRALASRIVDKFQTYRRETREANAGAGRDKERDRLAGLAADLRRVHESHEQAASGWTADAAETKKKLRHARNEVFMQVKVLLDRLGELDRLRDLETLSFQSRIDRLEAFLRE